MEFAVGVGAERCFTSALSIRRWRYRQRFPHIGAAVHAEHIALGREHEIEHA